MELASVDFEHARGYRIKQMAVVRYAQETAGEAAETFLEPVDRVDIEMVCRLVEDQQIGRSNQRLGECNPALLAAAHSKNRVCGSVSEAKLVKHRGGLPRVADGLNCGNVIKDRILWQRRNSHTTFVANHASIGFELAGEDSQQGALASAIVAYHAESLPTIERYRDIVEHDPPGMVDGDAAGIYKNHRR